MINFLNFVKSFLEGSLVLLIISSPVWSFIFIWIMIVGSSHKTNFLFVYEDKSCYQFLPYQGFSITEVSISKRGEANCASYEDFEVCKAQNIKYVYSKDNNPDFSSLAKDLGVDISTCKTIERLK